MESIGRGKVSPTRIFDLFLLYPCISASPGPWGSHGGGTASGGEGLVLGVEETTQGHLLRRAQLRCTMVTKKKTLSFSFCSSVLLFGCRRPWGAASTEESAKGPCLLLVLPILFLSGLALFGETFPNLHLCVSTKIPWSTTPLRHKQQSVAGRSRGDVVEIGDICTTQNTLCTATKHRRENIAHIGLYHHHTRGAGKTPPLVCGQTRGRSDKPCAHRPHCGSCVGISSFPSFSCSRKGGCKHMYNRTTSN